MSLKGVCEGVLGGVTSKKNIKMPRFSAKNKGHTFKAALRRTLVSTVSVVHVSCRLKLKLSPFAPYEISVLLQITLDTSCHNETAMY